MSRIIGIDLGTTNSCVAVLDARGNPQVLASATAERTTPSVVAWTEKNVVLVGLTAKRQAITNPENTVFGSKRLIGRKVNAPEVSALARAAAFRIVAAPNGDAWIRIGKNAVSPQEIASHVLGHLRTIAEQQLGEPVTRAVVTVPAYFDEAQRQATRDAGAIAGLDIVRIVNEPTAAALAYGAHRVSDKRRIIAVFDLGGGTFDISIMAVENGVFEVLATGGDSALGGEDWDRRMVERIADEIFDKYRVDVTTNSSVLSRLREACETAKRTLSTDRETSISLPFLFNDNDGNTINYQRTFSREALDELTADLRSRLGPPCLRALAYASLTADQIEEVLLVGGMTRWPTVAAIVEQIFGRKPNRGVNPDEVVAQGAAAFAGILAGEGLEDAALLDVTPHDIGIKVGDAQFSVVIPRNSMLPVRARRMFATGSANQKFVQIELFQGDSSDVSQNRRLGQVELTDLPPGPAGAIRIELVLTVDVESILSVAARETTTNIKSELVIRPSGGLSQLDISGIIDRRRGEVADASKK